MAECSTCPSSSTCSEEDKEQCESLAVKNNHSNIKKIIGVMSGKGGVGKSTISTIIARELKNRGNSVGILDADITGPSIPRLAGINGERVYSDGDRGIIPAKTKEGIEVISLNLMVKEENEPVIWRGPMIGEMVKQFYTDVLWSDLDYLVIDMPPGTGDVALTAMQSIPIDGIVMVSVPQDMVSMIVSKAINMTKKLDTDVIGVVQNMSYIVCPDCDKKIRMFEDNDSSKFMEELGTEVLAEFPMTKDLNRINNTSLSESVNRELVKLTDSIIEKLS